MLKIDVISGFLGAGKTTFIKRLLETKLKDEKVVLIENEYGAVSIDTDLLSDEQIQVKELSQGCICCSLVGDFSKSLNEVISKYNPDRILIEPSGVGKLSDIIKAIGSAGLSDAINSLVCMVDAKKAKMYDKNFGEFFVDQIENAQTVILSRMDICKQENAEAALEIIRKHNEKCVVVTTPITELSDEDLLKAYEGFDINLLSDDLLHHDDDDDEECDDPNCECHHHHHHHDDDEECCCGHDHDDEHEHHHHHHDDDEECCCGHHHDDDEHEHHHHHEHGEECTCGCHDHHHHHHADEVFTSIGFETGAHYTKDQVNAFLSALENEAEYGLVLRAKGMLPSDNGIWIYFDYVPGEVNVREGSPEYTGRVCVIGSELKEDKIKELISVKKGE